MIRERVVIGLVAIACLATGCAKTPGLFQATAPTPEGSAESGGRTSDGGREGSQGQRGAGTFSGTSTVRPVVSEFSTVRDLRDIHFDFEKYDIRAADTKVLDANAEWLKTNRNQLVVIEGHADERGTNEYNLALADRRAKAAMNYLVAQGVAASRITIVSYGEERPVCREHADPCWDQNRRAHFTVKRQ
jgi:peptidoglycan-associated lipoprotein